MHYSIVEKILKYSKIVKTIGIVDTYYKNFELKSKIKMSKKVALLNYSEHAPFNNPNLSIYTDKNRLYAWFYNYKLDNYFLIPQSYILYKALVSKYENGIFLFPTKETNLIIVIKDSLLHMQFVKKFFDEDDISRITKEVNIDSEKIITINNYETIIKDGWQNLKLNELWQFTNFEVDRKVFFNWILNKISIPLFAFVSAMIISQTLYYYYLTQNTKDIKKEYIELKNKNSVLKKNINSFEKSTFIYKDFLENNSHSVDRVHIMQLVCNKLKNEKGVVLRDISFRDSKFALTLDINNTEKFFNQLLTLDLFSTLKINSSMKLPHGRERVYIGGVINDK